MDGRGSTQITTGNFRGIVVDKEGNLYAADQILNGIVKFKAWYLGSREFDR